MVDRSPMDSKQAARMRQPMTRAEVYALMTNAVNTILAAMNELEGRIQQLEQAQATPAEVTPSGLVLPVSAR